MELMWLVYAVENLTYSGSFFMVMFWTLFTAIGCGVFFSLMFGSMEERMDDVLNFWKNTFPVKSVILLLVLLLTLHTILPTRDTAIKMAGAYLLQSVVTNDKTKELSDAAYRATLRQLTKWAEEVPELAEMLIDAGKEKLESEIKAN